MTKLATINSTDIFDPPDIPLSGKTRWVREKFPECRVSPLGKGAKNVKFSIGQPLEVVYRLTAQGHGKGDCDAVHAVHLGALQLTV